MHVVVFVAICRGDVLPQRAMVTLVLEGLDFR